MKKIIIIFLCLFINPWHVAISGEIRSIGAPFLRIEQGARPSAMGGAFVAVSDDGNAGYWNPAGLAHLKHLVCLHASHTEWRFSSIRYDYGGVVVSMNRLALGVSGFHIYIDDLEYRREKTVDPIDTFDARDIVATGSLAILLFNGVSVGINGKYLKNRIRYSSVDGYAFDLGGMCAWRPLSFAAVLKNVPLMDTYPGELPKTAVVGIRLTPLRNLMLTGDYNYFWYRKPEIKFGLEYQPIENVLAVRVGYNWDREQDSRFDINNLARGIGVYIKGYHIAYAYCPKANLPATHRFSMEFAIGAKK